MPFPLAPVNGEQTTQNGIVYIYNSTLGVWAVLTNTAGNISAGNIVVTNSIASDIFTATGNITGNYFIGNGSQLTSLPESYTNANVEAYLPTYTGNLSSLTGNVTTTATVSGSNLLGTIQTAAQPNITSVGTLSSVSVSGNISSGNLATNGGLSVTGTTLLSNKPTISFDGTANLTNADSMFEITDSGATSTPSMAFHRPALYATKITLNTDNALYFGGWSIGAGAQTIVTGQHNPGASNTYDLGTTALRWRNIYTNDLNLSNGIGDYTIVEGEQDLFLYNNKQNKVYKFALIEVDPESATPKIDQLNKNS